MELQNPKGSNDYSIANAKAHSTPSGSDIICLYGFPINMAIRRIAAYLLKEVGE